MITLFPDQDKQVQEVRQALVAGHKSVLMQASTGAGKTIMASYMLRAAMERGTDTWFVCPRKELIKQTSATFDNFNIPHSYIASGMEHKQAPAHVVSLQTVGRRLKTVKPPRMAVIDEVHWGGGMVNTLINWLRSHDCYIIGLSATPKLQSGEGLNKWFDHMVLGTPMAELIRLGRLSDFKIFAPEIPDLSDIKITAGDYNKKALSTFMEEHGKVMIGNAVKTYADNAMGLRGITFCTSIAESKRTAQAFNDGGIPAAHLDGSMSTDVRRMIIEAYADGKLMQLCSVDLMTFGFDLAAQVGRDITIECMSDIAPTKSESKQLQKWGRVLRAKEKPALILDHAGNVFEHGKPDDERNWTLEGRKKKRRAPQEREVEVRQCTECYFCYFPAPKCPNCGHVPPVQSRVIKQVDGELKEIQEVQRRKEKRMEVGKAKTRADLEAIAKERGYAKGWIRKQMQLKGIRG